jgi:DNA-binding transcriptional regulator YiaG
MQPKNDPDPHIDWSRFGKESQAVVNAEGAAEKRRLGLTGRMKRFRVFVNGKVYEIPIPNVRAIREKLHLSQADFARRFHLSQRTVQQWEQRRALPDLPARILLKAIEQAPDVIARAAADVHHEMEVASRRAAEEIEERRART